MELAQAKKKLRDIKVAMDVWRELYRLKLEKGYRSLNAVIKDLLERCREV